MKLRKNRRTKWTEEERQKLKSLFKKFDGDIEKISKDSPSAGVITAS